MTSLAPEIPGEQTPETYPVPGDLAPALTRQLDLSPVISGTGITVYANADWLPMRAQVADTKSTFSTAATGLMGASGSGLVPGAVPVLPGPAASRSYRGPVRAGSVLAAVAPAGRWSLTGASGAPAPRSSSFGWAARYRLAASGVTTLRFQGGPVVPLSLLVSVVTWLFAIVLLLGGGADRRWRRLRRRRHRTVAAGRTTVAGGDEPIGWSGHEDGPAGELP
jgi:hypothetical protein